MSAATKRKPTHGTPQVVNHKRPPVDTGLCLPGSLSQEVRDQLGFARLREGDDSEVQGDVSRPDSLDELRGEGDLGGGKGSQGMGWGRGTIGVAIAMCYPVGPVGPVGVGCFGHGGIASIRAGDGRGDMG